ncbi:hypothetical protein ACWDUD_29495 [Rhodococcus sp. NPDC003382]|uniref:hypothetical protein n=1 Tax=unclassified Rhodococcus (in: high G+C Gram-positive bacteria) TaxID=192944 RepID=UPI0018CC9F7A|nr:MULTISPECIES: hypothetical protein [unclassified Rhodococcus (in: high G+C Gram-positive bacteria)]MBH0123610.1 hypothetical protein [Rhodococcus sp. CX]MCK8675497.1 hypothetical protein [Rhodococcus sp. HM1]
MIDDLIELAFAQGAVRGVSVAADGCDEYLLASSGTAPAIRVWVRPDGRFSRAFDSDDCHVTLGQVVDRCGITYDRRRGGSLVRRM